MPGVPTYRATVLICFLVCQGRNPRPYSVQDGRGQEGLPTVLLCVGLRRFLEGKTFNTHTRTVLGNSAGWLDMLSLCGHLPTESRACLLCFVLFSCWVISEHVNNGM